MTDQTRDEINRYTRLGPEARALVDDYDVIDLAEMLVAAKNEIASCKAATQATDARTPLHALYAAAIRDTPARYPDDIAAAVCRVRDHAMEQLAATLRDVLAAFNGMRNSDNTGPIQYYQAPRILPPEFERWQDALRPQSRP